MNNTPLIFWIVPLASLVALGFAWYFFRAMMRCSEGTDRMKEIADYATEMHKIKHPYDLGKLARERIEF